jgi:hypothetical protein
MSNAIIITQTKKYKGETITYEGKHRKKYKKSRRQKMK